MTLSRCHVAIFVLLLGLVLTACNQSATPSGQVIARVGDEDITQQELQNEFRWQKVSADQQKNPAVVKRVLGEIVLRKYLLREAVAAKLDREPTILLNILRSREQVLSAAIIQRRILTQSNALDDLDVEQYINSNPLRFAKRKLLKIDQVVTPLNAKTGPAIKAARSLNNIDQVERKLHDMAVPFRRFIGVLRTSDIPEGIIGQIEAKKAEDIFFIHSGQSGVFFKVIGEESSPITGEQATKLARQILRNGLHPVWMTPT